MKKCFNCNYTKNLSEFHNCKRYKDGKTGICKDCKKIKDKEYRNKNLEKIKQKDYLYRQSHKEEAQKRASEWYYKNRDYAIEYRRKHYRKNWEQYQKNRKKWNDSHPEFYRIYKRNYYHIRKAKDPEYLLLHHLRTRFKSALKGNINFKKEFQVLSGCDFNFIRQWFEFQFTPEMNWDNHGLYWHIDHVKSCKSFNFNNPKNILKCFHWSNLQPLYKIENLKKGCKNDENFINSHYKKALIFEINLMVPTF